jgi:hypothetical protein
LAQIYEKHITAFSLGHVKLFSMIQIMSPCGTNYYCCPIKKSHFVLLALPSWRALYVGPCQRLKLSFDQCYILVKGATWLYSSVVRFFVFPKNCQLWVIDFSKFIEIGNSKVFNFNFKELADSQSFGKFNGWFFRLDFWPIYMKRFSKFFKENT